MKIVVFKIPEEIKRSQNIFCFSIKPQAIESPAPSLASNVLEIYKKHIKEKREDERRAEFPAGARFIEPTIRLRKTLSKEQIPSPGMEKKNIRQEKEPEFKSIKLKDILKERENCALIADSGMGKTTILKELQYQIVSGTIPTEQIPVYFHFRDLLGVYSIETLHERIMDLFPGEIARDTLEKTTSTLFQQKRLLFLLDGLDQVEDMSNLPRLLDRNGLLSPYRVMVAGRPYIYSSLQSHLSHYQYLTLDTFSVTFAKEYLGENAYEHLGNLIQESSLRAPMLLSILKELGQEIGHEINRTRIYEKMIDKLLSRETGLQTIQSNFAINNEAFKATFSKLSYTLMDKGYAGRFPWTIIDSLLPELKITLGDFVRLTHMGLVSEVIEGSPLPDRDLEFRHQSFQEYLASVELKKRLFSQNKLNKEALINHLEYNKWDEVLLFLIGSLEIPIAKEIISFVSDYDLILAGKCIACYKGNKDEDFGGVIDEILSKLKDEDVRRVAAVVLGNIGSEKAFDQLFSLLCNENEDKDIRSAAAVALGKTGSERAVDQLFSLLSDKDSSVRFVVAEALVKTGSERAVDQLISLLSDKSIFVRRMAAYALGNIGSERAVDQLISLLSYDHSSVRRVAAEALGNIGSEKAFDQLISLLSNENEDEDIRSAAVVALENIGSEWDFDRLISLLSNENSTVRWAAAVALENIDSERAADHLVSLLNNKNSSVHRAAAYALGNIGPERDVDRLISLLSYEDYCVRRAAALALGNIGSERTIDYLIPLLSDKDSRVRMVAAEALGKTSSERAVDHLIPLLSDKDSRVRMVAAEALGKTSSERDVDRLISLLSYEDYCVRRAAALALGNIGSERTIDHLIPLLSNKDSSIRGVAAEALEKIGSERAVDYLFSLLSDKDSSVRWVVAEAMGNIGSERAVDHLFSLLNDENTDVRWAADRALGKISKKIKDDDLLRLIERFHREGYNKAVDTLKSVHKRRFIKILYPQSFRIIK